MAEITPLEANITPEKSHGITRRSFLCGLGVGVVLAFVPKTSNIFGQERVAEAKVELTMEDRITKLNKDVLGSSLAQQDKELLGSFLDRAKIANRNFETLATYPQVEEIRQITRSIFSNSDIDIDQQIFFLRDRGIFQRAITDLEKVGWTNSTAEALEQTWKALMFTSDNPITGVETVSPITERRLTPSAIINNYSQINTLKSSGSFETQDYSEPKSKDEVRINNFIERAVEIFKGLSLPRLRVTVQIAPRDSIFAGFQDHPWESDTPKVFFVLPSDKELASEDEEQLTIAHEAGHVLDLFLNPKLMRYLTVEQIVDLALLRSRGRVSSWEADSSAIIKANQFRGGQISVMSRDITVAEDPEPKGYQKFIAEKSAQVPVTAEEYQTLTQIYPNERWFWLEPVLRVWYGSFQGKFYPEFRSSLGGAFSWQEYIQEHSKALQKLSLEDPIFAEGLRLLKEKIGAVPTPNQTAVTPSNLLKATEAALGENLIKSNESNALFPANIYTKLVDDLVINYSSIEEEAFAENISLALFLSFKRDQNPEQLNSPYWEYYKKLQEYMAKQ